MSMNVVSRMIDGVTILDLSGRITLGEGSDTLHDCIRTLLAKDSKKILLNFAEIGFIDSSGIGELVSGFTTVRNEGGELKLLSLSPKVAGLLKITKLDTLFDIWENEAAALSSFA